LALLVAPTFLLAATNIALAETPGAPRKVFILHSYELNHVCGQPQSKGVVHALEQAGFGRDEVEFGVYAMDTKRKNNTPALMAEQAEIARERIEAFGPDVLVILDDNAFRTVALPLAGSDLPIVFSGMNNQPELYNATTQWMNSRGAPGHNVTGVYEKLHFATAVKVQKRIQPSLERVRIFSDNSPTGKAIVRQIKTELEQNQIPAKHDFFITDSWEEYQAAILAANGSNVDTLYPVALRLQDNNGKTYTANDILTWTAKNSTKPSIPLNFVFVELGLFGGAGVDFESMGRQAGAMVAKILDGVSASDIAIEEAQRYALVFHLNRAQELGIEIPDEMLLAADEVYKD